MEKKSSKKKYLIWGIIITIIVVVVLFFTLKKDSIEYTTETVTKGSIVQTVSVTGQIKFKSSASLRFKISGIIDRLFVDVGDGVYKGQLLASLNTQELERKLIQVRANLNSAEVKVTNANQAVADTKTKNSQAVNTIYTDAPKVFAQTLNFAQKAHASFSGFYDQSGDVLDSIERSTPNYQLVINSKNAKTIADSSLANIADALSNFPTNATTNQIDEALVAIASPLQSLQNALSALIDNIAGIKSGLQVSASTLKTYKATLNTAQTNLNSALANEIDLRADLHDVVINNTITLNSVESDYRLKVAQYESAKADVAIAQRNLSDAQMRAPINAIISAKNKEIGELVTINDIVYKLIGDDEIEVIADIPEVDIGQIAEGNPVDSTLDAFSSEEHFPLTVTSVEPDQTMLDGVVHYKTHFEFDATDPRFKSGMSVNLEITTLQLDDVLVVPRGAIERQDNKSYLKIYRGQNQEPELREISTGKRGDDNVEIISGAKVGEVIVIGIEK